MVNRINKVAELFEIARPLNKKVINQKNNGNPISYYAGKIDTFVRSIDANFGSYSPSLEKEYKLFDKAPISNKVENNNLTLNYDEIIDLGTVNGKPLKVLAYSDGCFSWGGSIGTRKLADSGTPEEAIVLRSKSVYNDTDHNMANPYILIVTQLFGITKKVLSTKNFEETMNFFGNSETTVKEGFKRLGLNPDDIFTINGRSFKLDGVSLKELSNEAEKNSININLDQEIDLGNLNGKPIKMKIKNNSMEWSGSPAIPDHLPGSKLTSEQAAAIEASKAYSASEFDAINPILMVTQDLFFITKKGFDVGYFESHMNQFKIPTTVIENGLERLGLNPKEVFTVNGRSFKLEGNKLIEIKNEENN